MWECSKCSNANSDGLVYCASCNERNPSFSPQRSSSSSQEHPHTDEKPSRSGWKTALLWIAVIFSVFLTQGLVKPLVRDYMRGWHKITAETLATHSVAGLTCTAPGKFTAQPLSAVDPEDSNKIRDFYSDLTNYENSLPGLSLSILHGVLRPSHAFNLDGAVSEYIARIAKAYSPDQYKYQTYALEVSGAPAKLIDVSLMSRNQSRALALIFTHNAEMWSVNVSYPLANTYAAETAINFLKSVEIQN